MYITVALGLRNKSPVKIMNSLRELGNEIEQHYEGLSNQTTISDFSRWWLHDAKS